MRLRKAIPAAAMGVGLAILIVVGVLRLERHRERWRRSACISNLSNIGLGIKMYAGAHGEQYPSNLSLVAPFIASETRLFWCPSRQFHVGAMTEVESWADYLYFKGFTGYSHPDSIIMMCRPGNHGTKGVNVLFGDGHVQWIGTGDLIERLGRKQERSNQPSEATSQ